MLQNFSLSFSSILSLASEAGYRYGLMERSETAPAADATCDQHGAVLCNGREEFGICNYGSVAWQKVAAGTWCEGNEVVGQYDGPCEGGLICNGPQLFGLCGSGNVVFQPVSEGTCCVDGKIQVCAPYASGISSSVSTPYTTSASTPPSSSCYPGGGPTATIENGIVHGTTTSLPSATATVNKVLGVPFAQPPVRFAPPERAAAAKGPIQATAWSPACIQQFIYPQQQAEFTKFVFNTPAPEESEDCLYLNVYAPSTPAPSDGRSVLFWIYGGSLQFGNAGQAYYDGSAFAAYEDVIVVTINYRTNVFGFATTPELPITEQNLGFLDQRFALEWVQRNIHAFGGSPDKVTIFGESAGSYSVDALLTSYGKDEKPPFRGAILQSGQFSYNPQPRTSSYQQWSSLAEALNCPGSYESNLACLRAADATQIKTIIEENTLGFNPAFDNKTSFVNAAERRVNGEIPPIPVLTGTTAQEGRIFNVGQNDPSAFLQRITLGSKPYTEALLSMYPLSAPDSGPTGFDQLSQIWTEYVFQCTTALWANASAAAGIPTWQFYFNATFPSTQPAPDMFPLGAYHTSEIPIIFGTYPKIAVTTQQSALSKTMMGIWARFAKNPAGGPGWNPVGTGASGLVQVGATGTGEGGVYLSDSVSAQSGANSMAVLGNRHDVLGAGVTVIDSEELNYRCAVFQPTYQAIVALDQATAMEVVSG